MKANIFSFTSAINLLNLLKIKILEKLLAESKAVFMLQKIYI